ncbi:MAG: M50 family metallopeptidase, partial [Candidatus Uhrbacteria bacterium]|nr:M50 family metallopeptidase [Candidatus Uhrbacteria bacterium]
MIGTVILFLVILSLLVLVHEWGHFAAARRSGMKVEEFGLGFPPRIFGKKDKDGMIWSVNAIPLGGFVRIKGESGDNRNDPDSFASKKILPRFFVLAAGVLMNLVLAAVLFGAGFAFGLPAIVEGEVDANAVVSHRAINIVEIVPESAAATAGLEVGDRVISIDGEAYTTGQSAREALVVDEPGESISLVIARDGEIQTLEVTPAYLEEIGRDGVGVALVETGFIRYPWYLAPVMGVLTTFEMTANVVMAFAQLIGGLFVGAGPVAELSGPVGIAVLTGQVAELGFSHLVQFAAM